MHWLALLRRNPLFVRFWIAEAITLGGDWFSLVAISVLAVQEGGGAGAMAVAATLAAHDLPMGLVRPLAGILADRFDRRNLLIGMHLAQAALTAAMAERAAHADIGALQILVLIRSLMSGLDWPARAGALRRVVAADDLVAANALSGATWSAMYAVGMALGGVVSTFGVPMALALDAGSFVVGALLLATLPPMPTRGGDGGGLGRALRRAGADLREAAALAWSDRALLRAVAAKTPVGLAGGAGVVMLNVVADGTGFAGSGALTLGLLQASRGIGTGVGPMVAERLAAGRTGLRRVWLGSAWIAYAGIAAMALAGAGWAALLAAAFVWGCGTGTNWVVSSAELQRRAPDAAIGRLSGLDMLLVELSFAGSAVVGGLAIEATGVAGTGAALGIGLGATAWVALHLLTRSR